MQKTRLNKYRKSSVSENPLIVNMLKGPKHCLKLQDSTFIIFFHHFCETELENVSVSYMWKLRTLYKHIDKHFPCNCENLLQPIQVQLSKSKKYFLNFKVHFRNLHQVLNILKKKMTLIAYVMSKKHHFRTLFNSQLVNGSQTLVKSAWQHFYNKWHIIWLSLVVMCEHLGHFVNTLTADD